MRGAGAVSEAASETALAVWDQLAADAKQRLGWTTATALMRRTGLSRPKVNAALRELASGDWAQRTVVGQDGQLREHWRAAGFGDRAIQEAAE
jgi:DNA-binding IclR family transcriptional regulator